MAQKTPRKANIELLRIVSMLGITTLHYLYWNDAILLTTNAVTPLRMAGSVIESLCIPSVACYVLISGYCSTDTELRIGRIVRILVQVWVYSIGLHLLLVLAGAAEPAQNIWEAATYLLPIMTGHYWFASAFVVMMIFAPLLTSAAGHVSRKTLQRVIGALLVYESVIKTVVPFQLNQDEMGYDFGFFLMMYLIGAYLRIYGMPHRLCFRRMPAAGYLVCCTVTALIQIAASLVHARTGSLSWLMSTPFHYNFLPAVAASVCLFELFLQTEVPESRTAEIIRKLSSLTFGVYLIQCHADLLPKWPGWLAGLAGIKAESTNAVLFFLWMAAAVLMVYVVCSVADAVRAGLFDRAERAVRRIARREASQ